MKRSNLIFKQYEIVKRVYGTQSNKYDITGYKVIERNKKSLWFGNVLFLVQRQSRKSREYSFDVEMTKNDMINNINNLLCEV